MQWTVGHTTIQQLQNGQQLRNALQIDEAQHKTVRRCTQRRFQRIQQRCVQVDFAVWLVAGRFIGCCMNLLYHKQQQDYISTKLYAYN